MDFSFSGKWEWFFSIFGLLGLGGIMAILRAVFGKPKLEFEFCVIGEADVNQNLICRLKNSPFRNWVMKILFVPRPRIDDISVLCDVVDRSQTMSKVGTPFLVDMVTVDGKTAKQLSLPASILPVEFSIVTFNCETGIAHLLNAQTGTQLLAGVLYLVRVTALLGDKRIKSHLAGLIVKDRLVHIQRLPESLLGVVVMNCKYCQSENVIKYGKLKDVQRYYCKDCKRKFANPDAIPKMQTSIRDVADALNMYYEGMSLAEIRRNFIQQDNNYITRTSPYNWVQRFTDLAVSEANKHKPSVGSLWVADET